MRSTLRQGNRVGAGLGPGHRHRWRLGPRPCRARWLPGATTCGGIDGSAASSSEAAAGGATHPPPPPLLSGGRAPWLHAPLQSLGFLVAGAAALLIAAAPKSLSPPSQQQPLPGTAAPAAAAWSDIASPAAAAARGAGQQLQQPEHVSSSSSHRARAAPAFASVALQGGRGSVARTCSVSAVAPASSFQRQRAHEVFALKLTLVVQQILAAHVAIKILVVFTIVAPVVWTGGLLYSALTGAPLQRGLLKVWSVVIRVPGAKVTEETTWSATLLMNVFFLLGVFSFAVLIGIVSEEIKAQLKGVRSGNYPVVCGDHCVVLGWNRQSTSLLRKIAQNSHGSGKSLGRELVILAEQSKEHMDAEATRVLTSVGSTMKVVTREGAPWCVRDLEAVSAARAKTVIVLEPDNCRDGDAKKAATVVSLEAARSHPSVAVGPMRIILQNPEHPEETSHHLVEAARSKSLMTLVQSSTVGREMKLVEVSPSRNIARLIAQSAMQHGVANIISSIAQSTPGAPDFYLRTCGPTLAGRTYRDARRAYTDAVVCGYIAHTNRATHLNPPDSVLLHEADRLIVLAHSAEVEFAPARLASPAVAPSLEELQQRLETAAPPNPRAKTIVVLGWRGEVADLASALDDFAAPGSKVVFVSRQRPEDLPESTPKCSFHWHEGSSFDLDTCRRAGVGSCHSVIIGTLNSDWAADDWKSADARMLASLLVVQDLAAAAGKRHPPHVVATVHRHETVQTARHILQELGSGRLTAELLQPNELVTGMLLQVANEPGLAPALSELVDNTQGNEVYLRRPERYSLDSQSSTAFAEVAELARLRGETALGYVAVDGSLVLAPDAASSHLYTPDSRIVVMAED